MSQSEPTLEGRAAVVTGSTSGIGLAIARALAVEGAHVMLNGFGDPAEIEHLRAGLSHIHGARIGHSSADMSRPAEILGLVERAEDELGGLDILVNNAGIQHVSPIASFPPEMWERVIAINLSAPFYAIQAAIPALRRNGAGRIINIASAHGLVASADKAAYVAAKHGLVGLTKTAAIELAADGITVNAICPGWVLTPLVQRQLDARAELEGRPVADVTHALLAEKQPLARFSSPESIAAMAVFLCGTAASTITGAALSIDGGWTAQ